MGSSGAFKFCFVVCAAVAAVVPFGVSYGQNSQVAPQVVYQNAANQQTTQPMTPENARAACIDLKSYAPYGNPATCERCQQNSNGLGCSNTGYSSCQTALNSVQTAANNAGSACPEYFISAKSGSKSSFNTCFEKRTDCVNQEDDLAESIENETYGTTLPSLSLTAKCNATEAANAEDLKKEGEELETQHDNLRKQVLEAKKSASDAATQDQKDAAALETKHANTTETNRQAEIRTSDELPKTITNLKNTLLRASQDGRAAYRQFDDEYVKMRNANRLSEVAVRAKTRNARAACEARAAELMSKLEKERLVAKATFVNNTGSLSALTGSVRRFASRYDQDLNTCLATDYKRVVESADDEERALERNLSDQQTVLEQKRADILQSLKELVNSEGEQEKSATKDAQRNLDNIHRTMQLEAYQYYRELNQGNNAMVARQQNEGLQQQQLDQQERRLGGKIQLNANQFKQAKLTVPNPGPATTKATARKQEKAEKALERLTAYRFAYCSAVETCRAENKKPTGEDPGGCAAPPSPINLAGAPAAGQGTPASGGQSGPAPAAAADAAPVVPAASPSADAVTTP